MKVLTTSTILNMLKNWINCGKMSVNFWNLRGKHMKCGNCGTQIQQGDKFCIFCGSAVQPPQGDTVCPYCQGLIFSDDLFCQHCGRKLAAKPPVIVPPKQPPVVPPRPAVSAKKQKKGKIWFPVACVLVVLAVLFVIKRTTWVVDGGAADSVVMETPVTEPDVLPTIPEEPEIFEESEVPEESIVNEDPELPEEATVQEESELPEEAAFTPPDTDVEVLVATIRECYNEIVAKQPGMTELVLQEGVSAHLENGTVRCLTVYQGVGEVPYSRFYYYDPTGQLIFVYMEGMDAHRLYFYEGHLMRWRYSNNAGAPADAVNHDWEDSHAVLELEQFTQEESSRYLAAAYVKG